MAISDRIDSIEQHLKESYQELQGIGIDTSEVNNNLENIPKLIDGYWQTLPKVTGEGTSITLDNTKEGKMGIIYKGNTSQATSILPSGYTQVEYIQSSGTQYIDTGVIAKGLTTDIDIKYTPNTYTDYQFIFGARSNSSTRFDSGWGANRIMWFAYKTGDARSYLANVGDTIEFKKQGTTIIFNGNQSTMGALSDFNTSVNLSLFGNNNNGETRNFAVSKLYYCKIYDNNVLVRNFIPCYRNSDNEIGMYDLVNNVFYTNAGTGTFTKGNNVSIPNPDYPQEIQVVSGDNSINVCGKNLWKPTLQIDGTNVFCQRCTATLENDEFTLTSTSNGNMYYGYARGRNLEYQNQDGYLIEIPNNATTAYMLVTNTDLDNNYFGFYDSNKISLGYENSTIATIPENAKYMNIRFGKNNVTSGVTYKTKVMVSFSQITTYEPYQSASYPINLPVENLFNVNDIFNTNINASGVESASDITKSSNYIEALPNTTYTNSFYFNYETATLRYHLYDANKNWIKQVAVYYTLATSNIQKVTFTTTEDTKYIRFTLRHGTGESKNEYDIQLEAGSKANSYTPYGTTPIELCKIGDYQDRIFKSSGKNLFDKNIEFTSQGNPTQITKTILNTGIRLTYNYTSSSSSKFCVFSVMDLSNYVGSTIRFYSDIYYSSSNKGTFYIGLCNEDGSNRSIKSRWGATTPIPSFTVPTLEGEQKYLCLTLYVNSGGTVEPNDYVDFTNMILTIDNEDMSYEPYGTGWYLNKQIGKVVLDGSEADTTVSQSKENSTYFQIASIVTIPTPTNVLAIGKCTYFVAKTSAIYNQDIEGFVYSVSGNLRINILNTRTSISSGESASQKVTKFQTWLGNNNPILYYPLQNPTYTEITGELKNQLEAIKTSYEGQTNISQENNDLASVLNASALSNTTITPSLQSIQPLSLGQSLQNEEPMVDEEPLIDEETPNETLQEDIIQENDNLTNILDDSELENM